MICLTRCMTSGSWTRFAILSNRIECLIVWPVETSLEAVAFAEPCSRRRFRTGDLTEPAGLLGLVPPVRTRRADFPQRAPQSALARSGVIKPSGVLCEDTAARTMRGSASSSSRADDADFDDADGEAIEVGPRRAPTQACAHSDAVRSTDRNRAASAVNAFAGRASSSANACLTTHGFVPGTFCNCARSECGPRRIYRSGPHRRRAGE